jgi:hypothetical protein
MTLKETAPDWGPLEGLSAILVVVAMPMLDDDDLLVMMAPEIAVMVMAVICPNDHSILRASRHDRHHEPYCCETGNS